MKDLGTCRRGRDRRAARIGKQVQHADGTPRRADQPGRPIPVCRLLREKPRMLKSHRFDLERQLAARVAVVRNRPIGRHVALHPASAAALASIDGVRFFPKRTSLLVFPDHLRIGAAQDIIAPAFQALAVRGIDQFIFVPVFRFPHRSFKSPISFASLRRFRLSRGTGCRDARKRSA